MPVARLQGHVQELKAVGNTPVAKSPLMAPCDKVFNLGIASPGRLNCIATIQLFFTQSGQVGARGETGSDQAIPAQMLKTRNTQASPEQPRHGTDGPPSLGSARGTSPTPDAFIVDDEEGICSFVSMTLDTLGLVARSFNVAADAVAALDHGHPEIVFLDIAIGESDAVEVIRSLGEKRYAGTVQLMSGAQSPLFEDVQRIGAWHGLNMCPPLQKPFRAKDIQRSVASILLLDCPQAAISVAPATQLDLGEAVANGKLELWYEPKIDLRSKLLAGVEGVIRYREQSTGSVRAVDDALQQANQATRSALTGHFLAAVLRDCDELDRAGIPLRASLNASFDVLTKLDVAAIARQNRPRGENWPGLILGVGENEVIEDPQLALEVATQLRIYGITLAINNFGAAFSSFERLRDLPFSELKLHPEFVEGCAQDAKSAGVCRAAIDLAHRLGATAVATGLEHDADLVALQSMGCDAGQGPLLAEPMPKSKLMWICLATAGQPWLT
jgi:EAL domain-containing protein (putative c-di-GMP-specific phosphodiesterase class I)